MLIVPNQYPGDIGEVVFEDRTVDVVLVVAELDVQFSISYWCYSMSAIRYYSPFIIYY